MSSQHGVRIRFALLEFVVSFARNILSVLNRHVLSEIGWKRMKLYDFVTNVHCLLQNHPDRMNTHKFFFFFFLWLLLILAGINCMISLQICIVCYKTSQNRMNTHKFGFFQLVLAVFDTGSDKLYDFATNLHCLLQNQPESNEYPYIRLFSACSGCF